MIFVTVGTQLAFDRMIESVDKWAQARGIADIFFQIAEGEYQPKMGRTERYVDASLYEEVFNGSELIVGHAGMGSIITSLENNKEIIVFPRRYALGEHRNDHQMATAKRINDMAGCHVAWSADELWYALDTFIEGNHTGKSVVSDDTQLVALCDYLDCYAMK